MLRFQHSNHLLLLALLPVLAALFAWLLYWRANKLKALGEQRLVQAQMVGFIAGRRTLKFVLLTAALALAIVGWANLQGNGRAEQVQRKGVDVIIALDVSKSMLATDIQPNRLTRAQQMIGRLMEKMHNDRVGLVIFAGRAYLQTPLTVDYSAVRMLLQNVRPELIPSQGTVIGDAIDLSMKSFSQQERKFKSLIIISDGEDHDEHAIAKAREAADAGIIIHTVGIGSPQGITLMDPDTHAPKLDEKGEPVITKLNEDELKEIASAGHGTYTLLSNTEEVATKLTDAIDGMEQRNLGSVSYTDFSSYFQYFLLPAFLLLALEMLIPGASNKRPWKTA